MFTLSQSCAFILPSGAFLCFSFRNRTQSFKRIFYDSDFMELLNCMKILHLTYSSFVFFTYYKKTLQDLMIAIGFISRRKFIKLFLNLCKWNSFLTFLKVSMSFIPFFWCVRFRNCRYLNTAMYCALLQYFFENKQRHFAGQCLYGKVHIKDAVSGRALLHCAVLSRG